MAAAQTPFIERIAKYLPWMERVFLVAISLGAILVLLNFDASTLINLSLSGLALVFFLNAFRPPEIETTDESPADFSALLAMSIVPKVLWISASLSIIAILSYLLHFRAEGYRQLAMIGGSSLFLGIFIIGIFTVSGVKHLERLLPVVTRAVPLLLMDMYLFLK
ncbi:MAG: hypothetical protein WD824_02450 [Cyclobacteriaceae bacterium]